jgi:O-antigen/teichoic acid export membrane protein
MMTAERTIPEGGLRRAVRHGVFWSAVQSWGSKLLVFYLSILLTRLLSPEEFGIASAAALGLALIPMVTEFGFGDAILQRGSLNAKDMNLPFYVSLGAVIGMTVLVIVLSERIETWFGLSDLSLYVAAIAGSLIINALSQFQEAVYKRNMMFRVLALRTLIASFVAGVAAVVCAWSGLGIWSFVVQTYVVGVISLVWLWRRPLWTPGRELEHSTFRQMLGFGLPVVGLRLIDFAGTRLVDLLIIGQLGVALYGIYVVGAKFYLTLMELLHGAFHGVSLTVLSTIASDRKRLSQVYLETIGLSSSLMSPLFVLLAALSPEICRVLFGEKWKGVEEVAMILLLLGSVQCIQFLNGAFLSARGRPQITLIAGVVKTAAPMLGLLLLPAGALRELVLIFAFGQLLSAPVSFFFVTRELALSWMAAARALAPAALYGACAFAAVSYARPFVKASELGAFWQGMALGVVFVAVWASLIAVYDRRRLQAAFGLLSSAIGVRRSASGVA